MKTERTAEDEPRFGDKTMSEYFKVFTQVIASAKDENAKRIFPREWDLAYIALPMVCQREQHRPTLEAAEVEALLSKVKQPIYLMVAALLAGTGLRVSEMLALEIGKHVPSDCSLLYIRQQRGKLGGIDPYPKTDSGFRDVDLCPALASLLKEYIGDRKSGFLFETENGTMFYPGNLWRDGFKTALRKMGRQGVGFHAFRRFREAILQASECRDLLIDFWVGHTNDDMESRYAQQLLKNRKFRAEWSEKVGLGFELPSPFAIRNQQAEAAA